MKEQQQVPIHTEYIQIDQLLKLEGIIETGGQIKSFIDEGILTLNGQVVTEKRKKCRVGDVISCEGLDVDLVITQDPLSGEPHQTVRHLHSVSYVDTRHEPSW